MKLLIDVGVGRSVEEFLKKVEVVRETFASYGEELLGSFSVYQSGRLRIRRG